MINIVGKSISDVGQLRNSVRDGFNTIELQLYGEFLQTPNDEILDAVNSVEGLNIYSVHSPILSSRELEIEDFCDSNTRFALLKTMYLADAISKLKGMPVPVVVHAASAMETLYVKKDMLYTIVRELEIALNLFPNVQMCIENTIPVIAKNDRYQTMNSFLFDTAELCRFLRGQLKTERIYTVLDICHALTSVRFMNETQELTNKEAVTLKRFFEENSEVAKILHLNNVIELGLKPGQHSTPFLPTIEGDVELLGKISGYIKEYTPNAMCVLEINEEDYIVNSNANKLLTLKTFDKLGVPYKCL